MNITQISNYSCQPNGLIVNSKANLNMFFSINSNLHPLTRKEKRKIQQIQKKKSQKFVKQESRNANFNVWKNPFWSSVQSGRNILNRGVTSFVSKFTAVQKRMTHVACECIVPIRSCFGAFDDLVSRVVNFIPGAAAKTTNSNENEGSARPLPSWAKGCSSWLSDFIKNINDSSLIEMAFDTCKLSQKTAEYKLTPVHLACVGGSHDLLNALHKIGAEIDKPDISGYTPLHHMALKGDVVGVSTLLSWGANPEHRNAMGGTYADLLRFNEPFRESSNFSLNSTLFSTHTNDIILIDPKCIPEGVTFVDENVVKPKQLEGMWRKFSQDIVHKNPLPEMKKATTSKYTAFKASPPKLSIEPITHNDQKQIINLGHSFCGLIAKEPIKKGDIIVEYTGEMYNDPVRVHGSASEYLWRDWPAVDGKSFRGPASVINHGFPNAEMNRLTKNRVRTVYGMGKGGDGLPNRHTICAIQDIAKGEQITLDYGPEYDWKLSPIEMRPDSVIKFIKENSWQSLCNALSRFDINSEDTGIITQFVSLLGSTTNLIALAENNLMSLEDFKLIKRYIQTMDFLNPNLKDVEKVILTKLKKFGNNPDL